MRLKSYDAKAWKVYYLVDPRNHRVFYVGVTTQPLTLRLTQHLAEVRAGKGGRRKRRYILRLLDRGLEPVIVEAERTTAKGWERCEKKHVARLTRLGYRLVNRAKGGLGQSGVVWTEAEKQKIAQGVSKARSRFKIA